MYNFVVNWKLINNIKNNICKLKGGMSMIILHTHTHTHEICKKCNLKNWKIKIEKKCKKCKIYKPVLVKNQYWFFAHKFKIKNYIKFIYLKGVMIYESKIKEKVRKL